MVKFERKYYWLYGGLIGLVLYFLIYGLLYLILNLVSECWECFILLYILTFSCAIFGKIGYLCMIIGGATYFLFGSLIGFLVYKLKKAK